MPVEDTTPPVVAKPVDVRRPVQLTPQHAALRPDHPRGRVDVNPFHS